jgi:hypothetical protein
MRARLPFTLLLCLGLLAAFAGCSDEPLPDISIKLPPETQTGAGTMGFKIGDRIYLPKKGNLFIERLESDIISINTGNGDEDWGMRVGADSISGPGTFAIDTFVVGSNLFGTPAGFFARTNDNCSFYTAAQQYTGTLVITRYDTAARIISGRFSFQANGGPGCGLVQVTDGRFDFKF